jgi:hypothetical protein
MAQSQTIGPEYTVQVYNGTNLTLDEAALKETFQGVLREAKLPYGEYIIRIRHAATQGRGRSLEFSHTTQDIVTLFWFTASDVPDPGVAFRGILKIADQAIKEDLVLDLNEAALRYLCRSEPSTPPEESEMSRNTAAQSGHDLIVRKDRTIHIGLPGRLTRLLRQILVTAQLPPGRYEYTVKEVTTATDLGTARHHISVKKRVSRNEFELTFELSKLPRDTFIGTLVVPGKAMIPGLFEKLAAICSQLTRERWGDDERQEQADKNSGNPHGEEPTTSAAPTEIPTASIEASNDTATTPEPLTVTQKIDYLILCFDAEMQIHSAQIERLTDEYVEKLRQLDIQYTLLRQPAKEQLAHLQAERDGLEAMKKEAERLGLK